ncbi:Uncharacterized protein HZ326_11262 [Fusarium oxysporum f. sp. albedinis]|nr:Uncharacterized protein HZ326_11262 [Fusarium oxysporum f. sp. albedinis]
MFVFSHSGSAFVDTSSDRQNSAPASHFFVHFCHYPIARFYSSAILISIPLPLVIPISQLNSNQLLLATLLG